MLRNPKQNLNGNVAFRQPTRPSALMTSALCFGCFLMRLPAGDSQMNKTTQFLRIRTKKQASSSLVSTQRGRLGLDRHVKETGNLLLILLHPFKPLCYYLYEWLLPGPAACL